LPAAYPYFISFIVVNVFTVVQLLVAVVLEAFAEVIDVRGNAPLPCRTHPGLAVIVTCA